MDPVTQGAVGVAAGRLVARPADNWLAAAVGLIAGMAADIDVLIRSTSDPLLALEYHRHFTHSLIFIPFGALFTALLLRAIFRPLRERTTFFRTWFFATAGYATHAVLDACTTYGTQLFWPLNDLRVAWNIISVIDPLFTLPLIVLLVIALFKNSKIIVALASTYALCYLFLGFLQNQKATEAALQLADSRGHQPIGLSVKPSFANIIVWKSVYEHDDRFYVDAVRVFGGTTVIQGDSIEKLDIDRHFPWLDTTSQQAKDVERFRWFSNGHVGIDPADAHRIIDIRYSMLPQEIAGLWGIVLDPEADKHQHIIYNTERGEPDEVRAKTAVLWNMIVGDYE